MRPSRPVSRTASSVPSRCAGPTFIQLRRPSPKYDTQSGAGLVLNRRIYRTPAPHGAAMRSSTCDSRGFPSQASERPCEPTGRLPLRVLSARRDGRQLRRGGGTQVGGHGASVSVDVKPESQDRPASPVCECPRACDMRSCVCVGMVLTQAPWVRAALSAAKARSAISRAPCSPRASIPRSPTYLAIRPRGDPEHHFDCSSTPPTSRSPTDTSAGLRS